MIKLKVFILLLICNIYVFSQSDMIIDKAGNLIECQIIDTLKTTIKYKMFAGKDSVNRTIICDSVLLIKYKDGTKKLYSERKKIESLRLPEYIKNNRKEIGLLLDYGAFGLFNVNNDFKQSSYGDYTFGVSVVFDYRVKDLLYCGGECIVRWAQSETDDPLRLLIDPFLRVKLLFPIKNNLVLGPLVGAGITYWPKTEGMAKLHATYLNSRFGWGTRAALEIDYLLNSNISFSSELGYSISSSNSKNTWISHDMMLISFGFKVRV